MADHVHSCNNGSAEGRWYFGVTLSLNRSGALSQNVTTDFLNVLVFLYPERERVASVFFLFLIIPLFTDVWIDRDLLATQFMTHD